MWGATEWGIGYVSNIDAPPCGQDAVSHSDGICLRSTVYLDGQCIMKEGVIVDEELRAVGKRWQGEIVAEALGRGQGPQRGEGDISI